MAIKLMPGAHPFHATAEAASDAAKLGSVDPAEVDKIIISSSVQWTKFKGEPHPRNLVDAAHSLYYFVAASIADGRFRWEHMDPEKMADPHIAVLQDKISFDPNPAPLPDRFPHRHGGTVIIKMKNGKEFRSTCRAPRGSGPRGVEWTDIEAKYKTLVGRSGLSKDRVDQSFTLIRSFGGADPATQLTSLIAVD
jgi:2-methylcitrate dehydratase PrpD